MAKAQRRQLVHFHEDMLLNHHLRIGFVRQHFIVRLQMETDPVPIIGLWFLTPHGLHSHVLGGKVARHTSINFLDLGAVEAAIFPCVSILFAARCLFEPSS